MKKLILIATICSTLSFQLSAEEDVCAMAYKLSNTVIIQMQKGTPLPNLMKIADGNELIEGIIIEAYDMPRFGIDELDKKQREDFTNSIYLRCVKELR